MKQSAGTLLYRHGPEGLEVLLIHPSGNYNRHAPWGIPKGELEKDQELEETARRETLEEAGVEPGQLVPLGYVDYQKSRKRVHCFAGPAPDEASPRPTSWEVDQARFLPLDNARDLIRPDQRAFLDRLVQLLEGHQEGSEGDRSHR
jgi:predicted NUDIX family NTP pyrophosphohydrolase